MPRASQYIDLGRYPLFPKTNMVRPDLVGRCNAKLESDGIVVLHGFTTPFATRILCDEASSVAERAYFCTHRHNVYLQPADSDLPGDHPRNRLVTTDKGNVATDRIPAEGPLHTLYNWAPLRRFIADVLGLRGLHPYGDPLAALMINVNRPGEGLGWHFDNSDFAVTLMLRPAQAGGIYRYHAGLRSQGHDAVGRVLDDDAGDSIDLNPEAGTLIIFRGRESLHCVTPTQGSHARLVAVLSYATEPDQRMSPYTQRLFHGRVA